MQFPFTSSSSKSGASSPGVMRLGFMSYSVYFCYSEWRSFLFYHRKLRSIIFIKVILSFSKFRRTYQQLVFPSTYFADWDDRKRARIKDEQ